MPLCTDTEAHHRLCQTLVVVVPTRRPAATLPSSSRPRLSAPLGDLQRPSATAPPHGSPCRAVASPPSTMRTPQPATTTLPCRCLHLRTTTSPVPLLARRSRSRIIESHPDHHDLPLHPRCIHPAINFHRSKRLQLGYPEPRWARLLAAPRREHLQPCYSSRAISDVEPRGHAKSATDACQSRVTTSRRPPRRPLFHHLDVVQRPPAQPRRPTPSSRRHTPSSSSHRAATPSSSSRTRPRLGGFSPLITCTCSTSPRRPPLHSWPAPPPHRSSSLSPVINQSSSFPFTPRCCRYPSLNLAFMPWLLTTAEEP